MEYYRFLVGGRDILVPSIAISKIECTDATIIFESECATYVHTAISSEEADLKMTEFFEEGRASGGIKCAVLARQTQG